MEVPRFPAISVLLLLWQAGVLPILAFEQPHHRELANVDRRLEAMPAVRMPPAARLQAAAALQRVEPGAAVALDEITDAPRHVAARRGYLTGPAGEGRSVTPETARRVAADDPHRPVKTFLMQHARLYGHDARVLEAARVIRDYRVGPAGLRTTVWQQELDGVPIFDALMVGHATARDELVSLSSGFIADPTEAARPGRGRMEGPLLSPAMAVQLAAEAIEEPLDAGEIEALDPQPAGAVRRQRFRAGALPALAEAMLVWLPLDGATLVLCWQVELTRRVGGERFRVVLDARTGDLWVRRCLTVYLTAASYRVFTSDSPSPFSPGHATPATNQPPLVPRSLVTLAALSTNASPIGWIHDGANETRGNNVHAHLDRNADDQPDLPRPQGAPFRVFDFPVDLEAAPAAYGAASVVQLFYWCNWMHDQLYELGFTEAAGNFQKDNFGRGGLGNDPMLADAQDGSGFNNANFTPSPDGVPGRIQMFLFNGPEPDRDGGLDAEIILHEYAHGLSTRLAGGGGGLNALQSAGLGEGWSDFYALAMLSEPGDDPDAAYAMGGYATYQFAGLMENYYFGIRRYPYSTDPTRNPLTFKDIDPLQAGPHLGIPANPINPFSPLFANEVHAQGEVWCLALWEARANLIRQHGFAAGQRLILQLVTEGLRLSPLNPNFLEARDAILLADQLLTEGANYELLWAAFAKRGLGFSARSPGSFTTVGVVEAFDLPDALLVFPERGFVASGPAGGPFDGGCQIYTLTNYTTAPLEWSAVPGEPWLEVSPAGGTLAGRSSVQVTVCVAPEAGNFDLGNRSATVTFSNHVSGVAQSRAAGLRVMAFAPMPFLDDFESGRFQSHWNIAGTGAARAQVTEASAPHAGRFHLTLDGAGVNEFSRNEVTLGLDLAGYSNVVLRFVARNIGDEADAPPASPFRDGADFDGVAISADGVLWYEVQPLRYIPTRDTQFVVHLDEVMVAHGLSYTPAFRIRFNQFDDYAIPFDGLALDNVSVTGDPVRRLALHLPLELPENAGVRTNAAAVRLSVPAPADVVLQLRSGNPARLQVPTTVVLPAGATEAFFDLSALDNERLDGAEPVSVAAVAEGYFVPPASLTVLDDEQARLRVRAPVSGREGEGLRAGAGRVILDARPTRDLVVALTATPAEAVWVPPFVTVPAGQKGVDFDVIINDDTKLDGWEQAVLIARVPGWPEGRATFYIEDDDVPGVTVELPDSISEAAEATSIRGTVRLRAGFSTNVVVSLLSDNPRRLRVPAAVEIAAGQLSAEFALEPMDDRLITGPVSVVVSAGACGLRPATATVRILDDEIPVVPYAPRPSEGEAGVSPRADLAWRSGVGDIAVNGGFEAGSFAGWHQKNDGYGTWVINDGTFDPEGPEGPTPPREGAYSVLTQQIGAGDHVLYQDVALPADLRSARWSWWQRVRNHGAEFVSPNQEFRAEVRDTNDVLLAVAFASRREDPLLGPWEERSFDLSPWRGRTVRLAYVQHDNLGYFNVHLDSIRVHLTASGEPVFDVFFGTTTNLGAAAWAGTTATPAWALPELDLDTTYYWRVVSRMGGARAESPVWSFTTRSVGPLHRFAWSWIPSPQPLGQAIPVTLTAQDDLGETVTNFHGAVALTGLPGNGNAGAVVITEIDAGNDDRVEFANAAGRPVDISDWEVVFYEVRSWPAPHFTFRIPAGTVCEPGDLFLVTMRGAAPGDYPFFFTGTNLNWSAFRLNNPIAVLLRDRAGVIVDFACAVDANPGRIAQPAPVPGAEWLGNPITANTNTGWSYQRVGSLDHNDASDWIVGPATPGLRNEGLQLPFPPRATVSISPDVASNFVNGVWTGTVTVREPAPLMTLQAVSDDGPLGFSDSFTVTAANDVAIAAVVNPNLPIVGDEVTYTFTVDNSGPDRSGAVRLRYQPVAGSVFASAHASQGSCAREGDAVVCDLGSVEAGLPAIVAARFQVLTPGPATGEVILEMESPDAFAGNNRLAVAHPVNLPVIVPPIVSSVVEGHTGTTNLIFRLAIQPACRLPVSVNFQTLEVGARAGVDFLGTNGVILIPAGATNADLAVGVLGDALDETSESLNLRFFSPTNAIVLYPAVRGTIQDDDPTPKLAVDDVTVTEGPPGTTRPARFIVRLSAPSALEIAANYRVAARLSGTNAATAGSDYEPASGTLVFAPGTTQQVVTVTVHGDRFFEPVEEFALTFSEPTNVTLEDGEGVGTIVDDDAGALDRFSWNFIPSPQRLGRPFPVTITARDAQANVVSNFDGAVDLRALAHTGEIAVGHGTNGWAYPLATSFHDARTQIIYPAEELAGAGTLNGLSLFVLTAPGQTLSNWTLRLRHTPLASYTVPAWEGEGWTTVYQRDETIRADGWVTFHFDRPFAYDGTNHLMVDLSFDNASYSRDGWCAAFETSGRRALVFQTDSAFGDPRQWQGGVSPRPVALNRALNVRWSFERPLRLVPAQTTSFSRGVWTGEITVFDAAPNVLLRAVGPEGVGGTSLAFAVESDADTNHNGLPDDWELACFGFLYPEGEGADDDPDQDGRTNSAEYLAGTHPADGWSVLAIAGIEQRDGGVRLRFTTVAGRRYQIEWATDLARPVWQSLGPPVEGRGDTVTVTDAGGGGGNRFYRVRVGP